MTQRRSLYHPNWNRHDQILIVVLAAFFLLGQIAGAYLNLCGVGWCF